MTFYDKYGNELTVDEKIDELATLIRLARNDIEDEAARRINADTEIEGLQNDISDLQEQVADLTSRLDALEETP